MNSKESKRGIIGSAIGVVAMVVVLILCIVPGLNPARISGMMSNTSLVGGAFNFSAFKGGTINDAIAAGLLDSTFLGMLQLGMILTILSCIAVLAGSGLGFIGGKIAKISRIVAVSGCVVGLISAITMFDAYASIGEMTEDQVNYFKMHLPDFSVYRFFQPILPATIFVLVALFMIALVGNLLRGDNFIAENIIRFSAAVGMVGAFFAATNPARIVDAIGRSYMLFTSAVKKSTITEAFNTVKLKKGYATEAPLKEAHIFALIVFVAVVMLIVTFCMFMGELRMRRVGAILASGASLVGLVGLLGILTARAELIEQTSDVTKLLPLLPMGIFFYFILFTLILIVSVYYMILAEKPGEKDLFEIKSNKKLFLYMMPFIALVVVFSYLPLYFWRTAFYNYTLGLPLTSKDFAGMKYFKFLFADAAYRKRILTVMKNTLSMSGLGLLSSVVPVIFAIFISEIKRPKVKKWIQTFTTLPNFISWVLVYSVATAMFDSKGLWNVIMTLFNSNHEAVNYLNSNSFIYIKMLLWGMWKGLGWSAIVYIAAISGIDQQLYEAATVDGAGRFRKMWHITVPGLIPTFFVLFLLSIAGILSNGMDQYFVFDNTFNHYQVEVLDLYVYNIGIGDSQFELATVVGMLKTIVSLVLLFSANALSKAIRGESVM